MGSIINVARNLARPGYFPEMVRKVGMRLRGETENSRDRNESTAWCRSVVQDDAEFAKRLDPNLWRESGEFADRLTEAGEARVGSMVSQIGRGGHYRLLYFLTRLRSPETVVETGVASGFSSAAFLSALERNGRGHLYSSDFPLFRLAEPEKHIGTVVREELRERWTLLLEGDRANLPRILDRVTTIDLFHYDSDKSTRGREFAMALVAPLLSPEAIVVMDDIQDNLYFKQFAENRAEPFRVFEFQEKFVGVVGI